MRFLKRVSQLVGIGVIGFWAISAPLVTAQNDPASNPSSGLRVSPTRAELTVEQGSSETARFTVTNVTGGRIVVRSEVNDFSANIDGSIQLQQEGAAPTANSIKPFVSALPDKELQSGESFDAEIPVNVANGTAPGAYYGAMLFQAVPITEGEEDPGQVALSGSVGALILVQVPGEITEKMSLISLRAGREVKVGEDQTEFRPNNLLTKLQQKFR